MARTMTWQETAITRRYPAPRTYDSPMIMLARTRLEDLEREIEMLQLAREVRAARPRRRSLLQAAAAWVGTAFRTRSPHQAAPA